MSSKSKINGGRRATTWQGIRHHVAGYKPLRGSVPGPEHIKNDKRRTWSAACKEPEKFIPGFEGGLT